MGSGAGAYVLAGRWKSGGETRKLMGHALVSTSWRPECVLPGAAVGPQHVAWGAKVRYPELDLTRDRQQLPRSLLAAHVCKGGLCA